MGAPDDKRLVSFRIAHEPPECSSASKRAKSKLNPESKAFDPRVPRLEAALVESQRTCEELRAAVASARREAEEARREAEAARVEAAHEKATAECTLEKEAELVWGEAEAWVEHEEFLDRREESLFLDDERPLLHEKLSSPTRRPPSPEEAKRRHDERQRGAELNRRQMLSEHRQRLREAAEHGENVRARSTVARSERQNEMASRHARAGGNRAAYLECVRRRAVRETAKVEEVSWMNSLTANEVQADLQRRLQEVEARIEDARTRRSDRLRDVQTKQKKREKTKQEQLSAQTLRRAEMAADRWASLQNRLKAVEQRRALRLERVRLLQADKVPPQTDIVPTQRRRNEDDDDKSPPKPCSHEKENSELLPKKKKKKKKTAKQPTEMPRLPSCDDLTLDAAFAVETAWGATPSSSSSCKRDESHRKSVVAARALLSAQRRFNVKETPRVDGAHLALVVVWALRRWLGSGTAAEDQDDRLRVALAATDALALAAQHHKAVASEFLKHAAARDALRDALGAAPDLALAVSTLGAVTALVTQCDTSDLHRFLFDDDAAAAIVAALVATCLSPADAAPLARWRVALWGLRALNACARIDRTRLDATLFSSVSNRPQLLHLLDRLFADCCDQTTTSEVAATRQTCLDHLIELVGHFALQNQECLQWGPASKVTLLHRLLQLPFKYFSRPHHKDILFPTLIAGCIDNDRNSLVAANELSMQVLADYVRGHLQGHRSDDDDDDDRDRAGDRRGGNPTTSAESRVAGLAGRIPRHLWPRALAYFDRLANAETLD